MSLSLHYLSEKNSSCPVRSKIKGTVLPLQWRHNGFDGLPNHQPHDCLLNHLFRRRSKKTPKLRVTGLCAGNSPVNSPHKWPVTWKMFPFDDVIMYAVIHHLSFVQNQCYRTCSWEIDTWVKYLALLVQFYSGNFEQSTKPIQKSGNVQDLIDVDPKVFTTYCNSFRPCTSRWHPISPRLYRLAPSQLSTSFRQMAGI